MFFQFFIQLTDLLWSFRKSFEIHVDVGGHSNVQTSVWKVQ